MIATIASFRTSVRELTQDTSSVSYHHTDAQIDTYVADAFRHLFSVRPESRYDAYGRLADVAFPTDAAQLAAFSVTFDGRWRMGIAYHAASRALETDVTDSVNRELANGLMQKAEAEFAR